MNGDVYPVAAIGGYSTTWGSGTGATTIAIGGTGLLLPPLLMILFRQRYPWHNRVVAYAFILVTDAYPPFRLRP